MNASRVRSGQPGTTRYRPRKLALAEGESLMLHGDGMIERHSAAGEMVERWTPDDPAWAAVAIRFGLRASTLTVAPRGRDVPGRRPPV